MSGTPLQYSCLENPMDGGAWKAAVHGVAEGQTQLSDFTFTFHFHALEKKMATHSSVLAWRIPGTGGPGGLQSMGSHRVGHDWSDLAAAAETWVELGSLRKNRGRNGCWVGNQPCLMYRYRFGKATWFWITIMEKAMAPHSSTLAWKIPWTEEPVRLQSMGSLRVGHDWVTSLSLFTFMHWRRKWQPDPVFLPGESQGRGSLVGCHLWGRTELDTTEVT